MNVYCKVSEEVFLSLYLSPPQRASRLNWAPAGIFTACRLCLHRYLCRTLFSMCYHRCFVLGIPLTLAEKRCYPSSLSWLCEANRQSNFFLNTVVRRHDSKYTQQAETLVGRCRFQSFFSETPSVTTYASAVTHPVSGGEKGNFQPEKDEFCVLISVHHASPISTSGNLLEKEESPPFSVSP